MNKGFSLSEVIITLVVVGVISLLVVPNLIDTTTTRYNETSLNKARFEIRQAALLLQARCPRHRTCSDGQTPIQNIINGRVLQSKGNNGISYRVRNNIVNNHIEIIVDVDGNGTTDIQFNLENDGAINEVTRNLPAFNDNNYRDVPQ